MHGFVTYAGSFPAEAIRKELTATRHRTLTSMVEFMNRLKRHGSAIGKHGRRANTHVFHLVFQNSRLTLRELSSVCTEGRRKRCGRARAIALISSVGPDGHMTTNKWVSNLSQGFPCFGLLPPESLYSWVASHFVSALSSGVA